MKLQYKMTVTATQQHHRCVAHGGGPSARHPQVGI